jgi:hypothetical protein
MSGDHPEAPARVLEVWQEPSRLWRWRYLEPSSNAWPLEFLSNKEYESRELALRSATTAYPGVAVVERGAARPGARRRAARDRLLLLLLLVVVALLLWPRRRRGSAAA